MRAGRDRLMARRGLLRPTGAMLALAALLCGCGKAAVVRQETGASTSRARAAAPAPAPGSGGAVGLVTRNTTRLGGEDAATDAATIARTVYPGLTRASRPATVVLVDEHDWAAALAASALAGASLRAPVLYEQKGALPPVSSATLQALHPTGSPALGGAQVLTIGTASPPAGYRGRRVGGGEADPFALGAAVAGLLERLERHRSRQVIIANPSAAEALAMPAAGLAAESGAPILFATATSLPGPTRAALARMGRPSIYVVGPRRAIGQGVVAQLQGLGAVRRISAPGAVSNAIAVAEFDDGTFGWGVDEPGHGLVFANLGRPLDAPAAALLSATGDYGPLLLLEAPDRVPPALVRFLSDIQPGYTSAPQYQPVRGVYNHGWLIGGEGAITALVQAELDGMLEIAPRRTSPATGEPVPSGRRFSWYGPGCHWQDWRGGCRSERSG